jgi:dTDP-4-dehydrorhamnose reductase
VMDNVRPHVVIHCGAWSNLDQCEQQRESAFRINVEGTSVLADACAGSGVRLIFTSSDMVFDGERGNYDESDKTRPINFYGETKLLAEEKIQSICTDYVIVRVALVYGKPVTQGNSFSEKILSRFQKNTSMSLFRDQFRTPVWVQTVAEALLELADHSYSGVLHVAGSEKVDRYKFGLTLAEIRQYSSNLCKPVCMSELQTTAPRPKDVSLNISLAKQILKTCFIGYREGLAHDYAFNTNKM